MKNLILTLIMCIAMIGCGDEVTNINGYTDEQVAEMIAASKDTIYQVKDGDSVITYIYVTDTLYSQIIEDGSVDIGDSKGCQELPLFIQENDGFHVLEHLLDAKVSDNCSTMPY